MLHNLLLIIGVQGIRSLIEKEEFRILIDGTGNQDALPLPLTDTISLHTDFGVIA